MEHSSHENSCTHHHHHTHGDNTSKGLKTAFWLNAFFTIFEFIGGYLSNSTAIMTDAVHDLGDTISIGMGVLMEKVSKKEKNNRYTYGYKRFSLLSAVLLSVFLLAGASLMLAKSIIALLSEPKEVNSPLMLGIAIVGLISNGIGFWSIFKGNKDNGHNAKAVMFHLLEDVLGWAAVLIGSIVIYFTHWNWIDPVLSIAIALFIISRVIPNLIKSGKVFLQSNPLEAQTESIKSQILELEEISDVKQIQIWTLDGIEIIASIQVIAGGNSKNSDQQLILEKIQKIAQEFGIYQSTIQIEHLSG